MYFKFLFALSFALSSAQAFSATTVSENSPRALVHLLDYLAQDYGGAVSHGKIISASEYQEQMEFSEMAAEMGKKLESTRDQKDLLSKLDSLHEKVIQKAEFEDVATTAQNLKTKIIELSHLEVAPLRWPNMARGQQVYAQNCVTCHGDHGDGKGPAAQALNPKPLNFLDQGVMSPISPFKAFNAIRIGVPGTAMAANHTLSDEDAWAVAFYVNSLRYAGDSPQGQNKSDSVFEKLEKKFPLNKVATLSDDEFKKLLDGDDAAKQNQIATLRTHSGEDDYKNSLDTAKFYLQAAISDYRGGNGPSAKNKALLAYLEGIEPIEPRLKASDPELTADLEAKMGAVRTAIENNEPLTKVLLAVAVAEKQMELARMVIGQAAPSPWLTFLIASAILLREGFEAVLIIIALLGVLRASGAKEAARWVHGGWAVALGLGFVAWFFSGWLMVFSGAQRELMEGVTSLLAVLVLLYMGFWLHRTTEIGRWKAFINGKVKNALEGSNLFGLAVVSFTAVFREAFETVLFLRALWLEGGSDSKAALVAGVFGSLTLVFIIAWAILKYTTKIPIKKVFDFSAALMALLAIILVGKGIHSLQEMGMMTITPSPLNSRFELIGFFPTLETTISQAIVSLMILALWNFGKKPSRPNSNVVATTQSPS